MVANTGNKVENSVFRNIFEFGLALYHVTLGAHVQALCRSLPRVSVE